MKYGNKKSRPFRLKGISAKTGGDNASFLRAANTTVRKSVTVLGTLELERHQKNQESDVDSHQSL